MSAAPEGFQDMSTVRLVRLPVQVHVAAAAHQEALQREFELMLLNGSNGPDDGDGIPLPVKLTELVAELEEEYGGLSDQPAAALAEAIERGDEAADLEYRVPPGTDVACARLAEALDEIDAYCRQGEHLLTLATPPDLVAYRRWFLGEFVAQMRGDAPTPWPEFAAAGTAGAALEASEPPSPEPVEEPPAPEPDHRAPKGWSVEESREEVVVRPRGELDLQSAPQLRDLIQVVRREHTARVVLDLSEVSFVDSVGLSVVVSAHQRLTDDGVEFAVVIPQVLQRLFEISGLGQILDLRS